MFDVWVDISNVQTAQYCHNELGNTLFSAHITAVEYVTRYSYYFVVSKINTYYYIANALLGIKCSVTSLRNA